MSFSLVDFCEKLCYNASINSHLEEDSKVTALNLGTRREMFWDDYLIDSERTSAFHRLIPATKYEPCFEIDRPWSARSISYPCILKDDKGYKMYYFAISDIPNPPNGWRKKYLSLLESDDGIHWDYAEQSLVRFDGYPQNNILG